MPRRLFTYILVLCLAGGLTGCAVARHIPPGEYVLNENKVIADRKAPRSERVSERDIEGYIIQSPAVKFAGTNLPVWVYNMADPDKNNGWNNFIRKVGNKPVILDTARTQISAANIKAYMDSRGFFDSESHYSIKYNQRLRKARVTYSVVQGEPYRIETINYDFRDDFIRQVIMQDSTSTLLRVGDILDIGRLDRERLRIANYLKNRGYYNFSIDNIHYTADTLSGDHNVDLTMTVRQHLAGFDPAGDAMVENNPIYRIRNIYVYPDYNSVRAAVDANYGERLDTVFHDGIYVVSHGRSKVRPETLRRAVTLYSEYIYSQDDVRRIYDNILRLGYFRSASILFSEAAVADGYVTFVGDDEQGEEAVHTAEKYLDCNIYCVPGLRQGFSVDAEASSTSSFYGLKSTLSYQNRNLFRGSEYLNVSLTGGYEFLKATQINDSYEIGAGISLTTPRFIALIPVDRANKLFRPQTRFEVSTNIQEKPYYRRTISGGRLAYSWSDGRHSNYVLRPLDVNVVKMGRIDQDFLNNIKNPYLKESYSSQLVAGISGSYTYNNKAISVRGSSLLLRINWETAGNLLYAYSKLFSHPTSGSDGKDYYTAFGIRFSHYVRGDLSLSNRIPMGGNSAFAYRLHAGCAIPYGNSVIPNDRLFYAGGTNSMRGWPVRTLGPGSEPAPGDDYPQQMGNLRLEANVEMRFPLWNSLHGALFFDVGNVWLMKNIAGAVDREGVFKFNRFYRQLGFNTGLGLRVDLNIAVIRLDWGLRLHDPNQPAGQRWIHNFKYRNMAFNFGIGYPF